jgi:UbiD family decarboxylase
VALLYIKKEIDPKYEIAAYIRKTLDINGPAPVFGKLERFDIPVVGRTAQNFKLQARGY